MVFNESMSLDFAASTFAVHFLQEVFMKVLNVLFGICQIKISNYPSHSLSLYDIFNGENSTPSNLTIFVLAQARFFYDVLRFQCRKYDDINIQDTYMRLFLRQSKTIA